MNTQTDYKLKKNTLFKHKQKNTARTSQPKQMYLWRSFWYDKYVLPFRLAFTFLSWDAVDINETSESQL